MIDKETLVEDIQRLETDIRDIEARMWSYRKLLRETKRVLRNRKNLLLKFGGEEWT